MFSGRPTRSARPPPPQRSGETRSVSQSRLPCSLQPLSPDHPRPRAWLSSDEAWDLAKREVEERRERRRREELEVVEKARKQQEREQSEAVRVSRTKLLNQEVTEDWKFQVLHKSQIKKGVQQQENSRLRDERNLLLQSMDLQRHSDFVKLQDSIKDRIKEQNYWEFLKNQEKIKTEKKHIEENKESYSIIRQIEREDQEREKEKQESSETLKTQLLRQIGRNKSRKQTMLDEKKESEALERKRLEHLLQAENIQRKYETKLSNSEQSEFTKATNSFRDVRNKLEKDNDFTFLEEEWRLEKEKIQDKLNLNQRRKEINKNCASVNREIMTGIEHNKSLNETQRLREMEKRLLSENDYKVEVEQEKAGKVSSQWEYNRQIADQQDQNSRFKNRKEDYDDSLLQEIRKKQKYLQEIDEREIKDPIDKAHPLRKL